MAVEKKGVSTPPLSPIRVSFFTQANINGGWLKQQRLEANPQRAALLYLQLEALRSLAVATVSHHLACLLRRRHDKHVQDKCGEKSRPRYNCVV